MVRLLFLTALLAALAVALPAAAEEQNSLGPVAVDPCLSFDVSLDPFDQPCVPPADESIPCDAAAITMVCAFQAVVSQHLQSESCDPYDLSMPGDGPVTDTLILDPDGCVRSFIRRTLGWPPVAAHFAGFV